MSTRLKDNSIAVFGAGGFGLEVAMLIEQINAAVPGRWRLVGFFDDGKQVGALVNDLPVLGGLRELNAWPTPLAVVFALGMPGVKKAVVEKVDNDRLTFPVLMHPSVICGPKFVAIGAGSIICAGTIITTNVNIGRHVILNLACTVGHETEIGDYCSFMPTCNISGEVKIGPSSFWGTGAKIINRKNVGSHTVIGAGAVVISDIPDNVTAVGVPARPVQSR